MISGGYRCLFNRKPRTRNVKQGDVSWSAGIHNGPLRCLVQMHREGASFSSQWHLPEKLDVSAMTIRNSIRGNGLRHNDVDRTGQCREAGNRQNEETEVGYSHAPTL